MREHELQTLYTDPRFGQIMLGFASPPRGAFLQILNVHLRWSYGTEDEGLCLGFKIWMDVGFRALFHTAGVGFQL